MIPFVSIGACVLVFLLAVLAKNGSKLPGRRFRTLRPTDLKMTPLRGVAVVLFVVFLMVFLVVGWRLYYSTVSSNLISDEPRASQ